MVDLIAEARAFIIENPILTREEQMASFAAAKVAEREREIAGELAEIHLIGHCPTLKGLECTMCELINKLRGVNNDD